MPAHKIGNSGAPRRFPAIAAGPVRSGLVAVLLLGLLAADSHALVRFDFEQKYYQHPGRQVWDFSIIRPDSIYHIFYHAIPESDPGAANGDTIWTAHSRDLKHWSAPVPILTAGQGPWDAGAIWAPDVFRDEENGRWGLAYTGCDASYNQTICLAYSDDLVAWDKVIQNPVVQVDTTSYVWSAAGSWSDFRDPFLYRQEGLWHLLATAKQNLGGNKGVLYHGTSTDLQDWTDDGPLFVNDGTTPSKVLESPQYRVIGATHHLLFGEFDTIGTTILSAADPSGWTMADRVLLDYGYAPELDEFDPGVHIFSRLGNFYLPDGASLAYVVRMDTLLTAADGSGPYVYKPHPMSEEWLVHSGTANLASPTYGDNPVWRGEPSTGLVGHGYYSSREYFQGPLSGRGSPGVKLGDAPTGTCESHRFPVTGDGMTLLVGGGDYPGTCYVALVDDADDSILLSATGGGNATMVPVAWDLRPFQGRTCYLAIVDQETGPMGYIDVDEIVEQIVAVPVGEGPASLRPLRHQAWPNPFNPRVTISFELPAAAPCEVLVWDLRGHVVWRSGPRHGQPGLNGLTWDGRTTGGRAVAAGTYLYGIAVDGTARATGKIALVK